VDPLKMIGVILIVLLVAIAGQVSFGIPGLVFGLLIGISVAVGIVQLLRTRMAKGRTFDPVPTWSMISDRRHQADHRGRLRA
jgi:hypothetical protein